MTLAWIDAGAGIAGDMLLGALLDAGADADVVRRAVRAVHPALDIRVEPTQRHQLAASKATVIDTRTGRDADDSPAGHHDHHQHDDHDHHRQGHGHRPWRAVRALLLAAELDERVRDRAVAVFTALAAAEGAVHGVDPDDVEFHEVGSLDAIGDVVGCAAALTDLAVTRLSCSVVSVGGGPQVTGAHGAIPIPGPAVLHLARAAGVPLSGGPVPMETATPTGVALLAGLVDGGFGPMPPMVVRRVGLGAGGRDPEAVANVCRVVLGEPVDGQAGTAPVLLEAGVDDLDPRAWPPVLARLLAAGADDAWLTPVLMKKGRPGHVLSVLIRPALRAEVLGLLAAHTSTIGVRETAVAKHLVEREITCVEVDGQRIAVKVARHGGRVVTAQPEWEDVARAAERAGVPPRRMLAKAIAAAEPLWED